MPWLKGSLIEIDACQIRGKLFDKSQTLKTLLKASSQHSLGHHYKRPIFLETSHQISNVSRFPVRGRTRIPESHMNVKEYKDFALQVTARRCVGAHSSTVLLMLLFCIAANTPNTQNVQEKHIWLRNMNECLKGGEGSSTHKQRPHTGVPIQRKGSVSPYLLPVLPGFDLDPVTTKSSSYRKVLPLPKARSKTVSNTPAVGRVSTRSRESTDEKHSNTRTNNLHI